MRTPDQALGRLARRQGGFVSRSQCRGVGLSDRQIQLRIRRHGWERAYPGVFQLPGAPPSPHSRLHGAQLWAGADSIICRGSAAQLHQLEPTGPALPQLYLSTGKRTAGIKSYRLRTGDAPSTCTIGGLKVTRVERTLLDLATVWEPVRVGRAMDDALRRGLTSLDRLRSELARTAHHGRPGARVYERLARGRDHRDTLLRSDFEKRMLRIAEQIPSFRFIPNWRVEDRDRHYYIDIAYPPQRVAVECQSIQWHLGEEAFKDDMARHRRLTLLGWTVLFYCWDDVVFRPEAVREELTEVLRSRDLRLTPCHAET